MREHLKAGARTLAPNQDTKVKSIQWGEETLTLETGKVARQADGSVIATLGETSVMANVTFARKQKPGQDFFPLTVHSTVRSARCSSPASRTKFW